MDDTTLFRVVLHLLVVFTEQLFATLVSSGGNRRLPLAIWSSTALQGSLPSVYPANCILTLLTWTNRQRKGAAFAALLPCRGNQKEKEELM